MAQETDGNDFRDAVMELSALHVLQFLSTHPIQPDGIAIGLGKDQADKSTPTAFVLRLTTGPVELTFLIEPEQAAKMATAFAQLPEMAKMSHAELLAVSTQRPDGHYVMKPGDEASKQN